jgi:putative hydrolase of the HAD superfamily
MTISAVFIDFGGVIVRTEDCEPRAHQAQALGMTSRDMEKIVFESKSAQRASTGEILEEAHWQAVAEALGVNRAKADQVMTAFFSGDRVDITLVNYLRSLRPEHKVCLVSNAWSGLRAFIASQKFDDVFDQMVISAEVGLTKPDARIYQLALKKLEVQPEESVFLDDVLINVEAARAMGMNGIHFTKPEKALEELKQLLKNHR